MELKNVTILELDTPNANGRTYTAEVGQSIVDQLTKRESVFGELSMTGTDVDMSVDLQRVSHMITDIRVQDGKLIGTAKILGTPMGNIARQLIEGGINHGFRPRGTGKIGEDGVITEYNIVSIDMVQNPA